MKHINKIAALALSAVAALSMTAPAFAADYSYTTKAPQDYYGSTSYEDVYGSQYNYGGRNVVDYDVPELEYPTFEPGQKRTFPTEEEGYYPVIVETGLYDTQNVEIKSGVEAGDNVFVNYTVTDYSGW